MLEASIKKNSPKEPPPPKNKFKIPATVKSQTNKQTKKPNKKCHVQKGPFGQGDGEIFLVVDLKYISEFCPSCLTE